MSDSKVRSPNAQELELRAVAAMKALVTLDQHRGHVERGHLVREGTRSYVASVHPSEVATEQK